MQDTRAATAPPATPSGACPNPDPERYVAGELLGQGGGGQIWRLHDRHLGRDVALKVGRARAEVEWTSRLAHPGIVAVHDAGELPDGRTWFTMREYPMGGTLADQAFEAGPRLRALLRVAEAVAYAHAQGVVHRDLKPRNILVGAFGEVLVADWGLAAPPGSPAAGGTRGYAAPEQLAGAPADPRADVYALGVMIAECGPPPGLADLVARCPGPVGERPADAREVADTLAAWLDGDLRREQSRRMLARVDAEALAAVRASALEPTAAPAEDRAARWAEEDRAREREAARDRAELEAERILTSAIELDPEHDAAHQALADLLRARADRAFERGEEPAARWAAAAVARHDRGALRDWVRGDGFLSLEIGRGELELFRLETVDRRRMTLPWGRVSSPVVDLRLPAGAWVARRGAIVLPFVVRRGERWENLPPGHDRGVPVFLPDDIGPDDCYVPAGWVPLGGDPLAADAAPRTLAWIDGFVLRRFPVTVEEYGHFLRSLPSDEAARWNPPLDPTSTHPDSPRLFEADGVLRSGLASGAPRTPRHPIAHLSGRAASRYVAWLADCTGEAWRLPTEWEREKAARGPEGRAFPWGDHLEADWACWLGCHPGPPIPEPVGSHPYDESVYGVRGLAGHVRDACANEWERAPRLVDGRVAWTPARSVQAVRGGAWRAAPYLCRAAARFGGDPDTWTGVVGVRPCRSVSPETRRSTP